MTDKQINLAIGAIINAELVMDFPDVILDALNSVIAFLATMDEQPKQKNGKWIPHSYEEDGRILLWECSECGNIIYAESKDDKSDFHNYCSECGADMREGDA